MLWEFISLAIESLKSNKMRALLTMLGIIIGIMSIISIVIIGDAMTSSVTDSLSTLGTNNITVSLQERGKESSNMMMGTVSRASSSGKIPTTEDLISDQMISDLSQNFSEEIAGVSLSYSGGNAQAREGEVYANISINGVNADFVNANNIEILAGRFLSENDIATKSQTAVVSDKFVKNIFADMDSAIGKEVKIYKDKSIEMYTVIGIYEYQQTGFGGSTASDQDIRTTFYIPVSTAKQDLIEKNYNYITVVGSEESDVNDLTDRIQKYFDNVYTNNKDWKLSVTNLTTMLDTVTSTLNTISIAIAFIAGISLLVGGIGVMNIMLVSVTERTREIGTRKALGAKNFHIQFQFVIEAIIISSIGGVIGLLLGIGVGAIIAKIFSVPLVISPFVSIGSVLFSMAIGVFFGLFPANKAAKLDPIEALRYE